MTKKLPPARPRTPPPASTAAAPLDPAAAEAWVRAGADHAPPMPAGISTDSRGYPEVSRAAPRAPAGTRALVERRDGRTRRKMMVYLAPETADALRAFCRAEGREMSHTIDEAVQAFLDARGAR